MLTLDGLRLTQGGFSLTADWTLPKGARLALIGPSGAGKSTLLAGIAGFLAPLHGRVTWDGTDDNGEQLADGTYTLKVEATDAEGDDISAATYVTTMVNEVNYDTSASLLVLRNGSIVSSGQVIAVR